jgi:hypothetical protein
LSSTASAKVIPLHARYPHDVESVRPFRIWNALDKQQLRWRYYSDKRHAHIGALIEARWAAVGTTLEVFDIRTGRLMGQYTRKVNTIAFMGGDNV